MLDWLWERPWGFTKGRERQPAIGNQNSQDKPQCTQSASRGRRRSPVDGKTQDSGAPPCPSVVCLSQFGSVVSDSSRPHGLQHARPPCPSPTPRAYSNSCPSNHLILCRPLLLLPLIFPSIRVFANESAFCIRWPKYWSFSFSISPSNEHSGLISFRMDWLDLLAVQGTLKSLL